MLERFRADKGPRNKKMDSLVLTVFVIIFVGVMITTYMRAGANAVKRLAGEYESTNAESTAYDLTIQTNGQFTLVDIGAGNHVMEGKITRDRSDATVFILDCTADQEYDGAQFLGMKDSKNECKISMETIKDTKSEAETCKQLTIENSEGSVIFEEKTS